MVDSRPTSTFDVSPIPIHKCHCQGFSTTVFAYGQTGTGKTHTVGASKGRTTSTDRNLRRIGQFRAYPLTLLDARESRGRIALCII